MYLINTTTLELEYFPDERGQKYAILSHCWGKEEVQFKDMMEKDRKEEITKRSGYDKIRQCCRLATEQGLDYAWVDTCCIDKSSSAELQEAINSMFRWYQSAEVCFAHLADVDDLTAISCSTPPIALSADIERQFRNSKWFKRGWTLQELLAPTNVVLCTRSWSKMGTRNECSEAIESITGIRKSMLETCYDATNRPPVAEIMCWAHNRTTTRVEDRAYSLIGLFDINMPMLYGEGSKAFRRLQEEILRNTTDKSLLAWSGGEFNRGGLLAPSPDNFLPPPQMQLEKVNSMQRRPSDTLTNQGASLVIELIPWKPFLYVGIVGHCRTKRGGRWFVGIYLRPINYEDWFARVTYDGKDVVFVETSSVVHLLRDRTVNIPHQLNTFEAIFASSPVLLYQCRVLLASPGRDGVYQPITLVNGAKRMSDGHTITIKDKSLGNFCRIDVRCHSAKLISRIELGIDSRFLPYFVFLHDSSMGLYPTAQTILRERSTGPQWETSIPSEPPISVSRLNTQMSEYVVLARSSAVLIRTKIDMDLGGRSHLTLIDGMLDISGGLGMSTCHIAIKRSWDSGWTFEIRIDD